MSQLLGVGDSSPRHSMNKAIHRFNGAIICCMVIVPQLLLHLFLDDGSADPVYCIHGGQHIHGGTGEGPSRSGE